MAINPNIILQGQQHVALQDPLEIAQRGMQMQQMGYQNQMQQRQMADDQATRQAYQAAMTAGPDGAPTLDRQKFTSTLAAQNPMLAYQKSQEFPAQDAAKAKAQLEVTKAQREQDASELGQIIALPPEQKQPAWEALRAQKIAKGYPGAANAPQQFPGDQHLYMSMTALMGPKDQVDLKEKQSEFASREADRKLTRQQMGMNKQNQALQQTQLILESAKGNPAVAQAQKDIYAADKFGSLVNLYGDANKLNPAQVQLAATEVAKIASGGVPSIHELQGLNPSTLPSGLASLAEKVINRPQSAEAGEFVKRMQDYTNALKADAQKVVAEKFGRVIETRKDSLGDKHYNDLKAQYLDPLMKERAQGKGGGQTPFHSMSDDALDAAYKEAGGK